MNTGEKFDADDAQKLCARVAKEAVARLGRNEVAILANFCDDDIVIRKISSGFDFSNFSEPGLVKNINAPRSIKLADTLMRVLARHIAIEPNRNDGDGSKAIDVLSDSRGRGDSFSV